MGFPTVWTPLLVLQPLPVILNHFPIVRLIGLALVAVGSAMSMITAIPAALALVSKVLFFPLSIRRVQWFIFCPLWCRRIICLFDPLSWALASFEHGHDAFYPWFKFMWLFTVNGCIIGLHEADERRSTNEPQQRNWSKHQTTAIPRCATTIEATWMVNLVCNYW